LDCIEHPNCDRVVALSGGYGIDEANEKLYKNDKMIASFSRTLMGGLLDTVSDEEFYASFDKTIQSIYEASKGMSAQEEKAKKMIEGDGFIAALDQSGGSTPKALLAYGITEDQYEVGTESMYDMVHKMRSRIITCPVFNGDRVIAAILFENTMDRTIEGLPTPKYLWQVKKVVPLLKCDKGLAAVENDCQLMKPIPGLDELLARAKGLGVYGTKMRSNILMANPVGIEAVVKQQFEVGKQIIAAGLVPIIEPEVDITSPQKAEAEEILKACIMKELDKLEPSQHVMLKLSLPSKDNMYLECIEHPNCDRVVALSGGYGIDEANEKLAKNTKMIASFSRTLMGGLLDTVSDEEFSASFDKTIQSIYDASKA